MLAKVRGWRAIRYLVVVRAGLETFIDLLQDVLHRYFTFVCLSVPLRAGRGKVCQEHSRCSRSSRAGAERSGNGTPAHVSKQTGPDCRVSARIPFPRLERWLSGGSCALSGRGPWAACPGLPVLTMMMVLLWNRKSVGRKCGKAASLSLHVCPPHDAAPATGVAWLLYRSGGGGGGHHNYNCCRRASCFASASPPTSWWHR